ncbi:MAG: formate--tetrahydrofolate ligase, partial [Kangiellaceae bacterium]|nr:formate--tetrahydrofolate ligase [Kangiellaceae bacterium]
MLSDVEIAKQFESKPIKDIVNKLGIDEQFMMPYGSDITKIHVDALKQESQQQSGKLILVSATTPSPAGEGKTTTTIGLGQA